MTGSDRGFPLRTGIGVAAALVVAPWLPQFRAAFFPILAAIAAVPLATVCLRSGRVAWLGVRHSLAAGGAAVVATSLPMIVGSFLLSRPTIIVHLPSLVETSGIVVFIVLDSVLSGWTAFLFQRVAERKRATASRNQPRWDPWTWGPWGLSGTTLSLIAVTVSTWLLVIALPTFPATGPLGNWTFFLALCMGGIALLGLIGLAVEFSNRIL